MDKILLSEVIDGVYYKYHKSLSQCQCDCGLDYIFLVLEQNTT